VKLYLAKARRLTTPMEGGAQSAWGAGIEWLTGADFFFYFDIF
jgi:hypothetical protein